jgi:hypothetical protein
MRVGRMRLGALLAGLLLSNNALAQQCDAWFPFDGDLTDASGNGYDGSMIGSEGSEATPRFVEGRSGSALALDGTAAMRAFIDLHYDGCPQVTISAWIRVDASSRGSRHILSTGNGSGPGLRISGSTLILNGTANGLTQRNAITAGSGWNFVAGVYDYTNSEYTLYWRNRSVSATLSEHLRPPREAFWVGAHSDNLANGPTDVVIDDLRITGSALGAEEVAALARSPAARAEAAGLGRALPRSAGAAGLNSTLPESAPRLPESPSDRSMPSEATRDTVEAAVADRRSPLPVPPLGDSGASGGLLDAPQVPAGRTPDQGLSGPERNPGRDLMDAAQPRDAPPLRATPTYEEVYRNDATGPIRTVNIVLPGATMPQTITYQEVDGLAVTEGDIILGRAADLDRWQEAAQPEASGGPGVRRQGLNAVANTDFLWPGGVIPFTVAADIPQSQRSNITAAVNRINSVTNLTFVARAAERDFVAFEQGTDPDACSAEVGRQSGRQRIMLGSNGCTVVTLMHEMLHAAGVWHEQTRPDRDSYVEVLDANIQSGREHNFERHSVSDGIGVGGYNFSSIMHYGTFAFGVACTANPPAGATTDPDCRCDADGVSNCVARTIRPRTSGQSIARDGTLASDMDDINALYPSVLGPQMGLNWGAGNFATAVAVGDVDGDGRGEIVVGRSADNDGRFFVFDDAAAGHQLMATGGAGWGAGVEVTDLAVGDIDGDGVMEIGVTRRAGSSNRFYVYRYNNGALLERFAGGDDWGSGNYATAIAFGDVDADGRDEIAVGRRAGEFGRYYLFDDAAAARPFERLSIGGSAWDSTHYTTALAFGDVDDDGRAELGVARLAASGMRWEVVRYTPAGGFQQLGSGGHDWGSGHYATSLAIGDIDGDGAGEVLVGRRAASSSRYHVYDDHSRGYALLETGGDLWGSGYYTVDVALADVDGDAVDEVIVARNAGEHGRYYVFDYRDGGFLPIPVSGAPQFSGVGATAIAAGDTNANGNADLAVGYREATNGRMRWEVIYMNPPSP